MITVHNKEYVEKERKKERNDKLSNKKKRLKESQNEKNEK